MGKGGSRFGAGRPGWRGKAEHCLRLDVRQLARHGVLKQPGSCGWKWTNSVTGEVSGSITILVSPDFLRLDYRAGENDVREHVPLTRTACHYGGTRPWLACPRCGGRAAVLFLRWGRFKCRRCAQLAYSSQSEDTMGRAWRLQRKLEERLGEDGERVKGMHHRTRQRIYDRIVQCEEVRDRALIDFAGRMGLMERWGL